MNDQVRCMKCGQIATGFASINEDRYCHGDFETSLTCFQSAVLEQDMIDIDTWLRRTGLL